MTAGGGLRVKRRARIVLERSRLRAPRHPPQSPRYAGKEYRTPPLQRHKPQARPRQKERLKGWTAITRRELLTSLRSRGAFVALLVLLVSLFAVIVIAWPRGTRFIAVRSEISRLLFGAFAAGEVLMVGILATVHSAGSMTVEKERLCIDFLMTSPLSAKAIVWGKLLSAVTYIVLLLIATLPLTSTCLFLGGISTGDVIQLYAGLLMFAVTCGLIGLTCSTFLHRTQAALAVSLLVVVPVCLVLLTISMSGASLEKVLSSPVMIIICLIACVVLTLSTASRMRRPFPVSSRSFDEEDPSKQVGLVLRRNVFPDKLLLPKKRDEPQDTTSNPVFRKEISSEIFGRGTLLVRHILFVGIGLLVVFVCFLVAGHAQVYFCYVAGLIMMIAPTFASNSITQEKERATIDLLLTTPLAPWKIVLGKALAIFRFTGILVAFILPYVLFGFLNPQGLTLGGLLAYLLVILTVMVSTIVIGLFFSLIMKTSLASMVATYSTLAVLFLAPVAAMAVLTGVTDIPVEKFAWMKSLSPFLVLIDIRACVIDGRFSLSLAEHPWFQFVLLYFGVSTLLLSVMVGGFRKLLRQ